METMRPVNTKDPLDTVFKMDSIFNLSFASGETAVTPWDKRTDLGRLDLYLTNEAP